MATFELLADTWTLVKSFAGIYEIPNMDYSSIDRFVNTPYLIETFKKHFGKDVDKSISDYSIDNEYDYTNSNMLSGLFGKDLRCSEDEKIRKKLLSNVANGWKSKDFYIDIRHLASKSINCICGCVLPRKHWRYYNSHYSSKEHVDGAFSANVLDSTKNRLCQEYKENPKLFHYSRQYDFCVRLSRNGNTRLVTFIDSKTKIVVNVE